MFSFDGGILRETADEEDFLRNFEVGAVFIDSNGFYIGISTGLQGTGGLSAAADVGRKRYAG